MKAKDSALTGQCRGAVRVVETSGRFAEGTEAAWGSSTSGAASSGMDAACSSTKCASIVGGH